MVNFKRKLYTDGSGYWSNTSKQVRVTKLTLGYVDDDGDFGELRVHFDKKSWDVNKHGLIYTDNLFEAQLQRELTAVGFAGKNVNYSEQGMQGDDYVSLDVGKKFLTSWSKVLDKLAPTL